MHRKVAVLFDHLLLLTSGDVVYNGKMTEAPSDDRETDGESGECAQARRYWSDAGFPATRPHGNTGKHVAQRFAGPGPGFSDGAREPPFLLCPSHLFWCGGLFPGLGDPRDTGLTGAISRKAFNVKRGSKRQVDLFREFYQTSPKGKASVDELVEAPTAGENAAQSDHRFLL